MTPDRKRRDLFLALIDALLEHVQMNTRMDIRDRIAALALVDRVLARDKADDDPGRAGSAVRKYAGAFQAANGAQGRAASDPRPPPRPEPDDDRGSKDRDDDDDREDERENDRHAAR
jgi:hypothetical protein